MICNLCLEASENAIDISGIESAQLNVLHILRKYFQFCFEVRPNVYLKCVKLNKALDKLNLRKKSS